MDKHDPLQSWLMKALNKSFSSVEEGLVVETKEMAPDSGVGTTLVQRIKRRDPHVAVDTIDLLKVVVRKHRVVYDCYVAIYPEVQTTDGVFKHTALIGMVYDHHMLTVVNNDEMKGMTQEPIIRDTVRTIDPLDMNIHLEFISRVVFQAFTKISERVF
jgi:hypothetical protein